MQNIPTGKSGIYIFFGWDEKPLYVGQALDLRVRVNSHFKGFTNTAGFSDYFGKCSVFFEEDKLHRQIYEIYLINTLGCPLNINLNNRLLKWELSRGPAILNDSSRCGFIKRDGQQCAQRPHSNGFCHYHGGNGVSRKKVVEDALEDFQRTAEEERF